MTVGIARSHDRRRVRASVGGSVAGLVPFLAVLWDFALDPLRRPRVEGYGSNFFDIQARSLLHGHLSVPDGILGIESFAVDGRTFMYFPPFPAVLRMPVLLLTDGLDGRLTAPSMLLAWVVLAVATSRLVWRARDLVRGSQAVGRFEAAASGVLIAAITGGTVLVYIASLPWVYHEVYMWSAAFVVATLAGLAGLALDAPAVTWRRVAGIGGAVTGLIMTRATAGWPMALATVATGIVLAVRSPPSRRGAAALVAAGVLAIALSAAINWAKFRHVFMIPLEHQQWTQQNARRRLALAQNDGSLAGFQFLPTTIVNYFRPDGIRFVPYFPFVTLPGEPARPYNGAFLDQTYRTGSVPAFMPALTTLAAWGAVRVVTTLRSLLIPMLGAVGVTATVMCYGYVGFRYTSEFVAVLALGAAVGLADLTERLARRSARVKRGALAGLAALTAFGMMANAAVGLETSRVTGRGADLEQFVGWQDRMSRISGNPLARRTRIDLVLPESAPPDELHILGDCAALYLSTGDRYEPWVTIEVRSMSVVAEAGPGGLRSGRLRLWNVDGVRPQHIDLETDPAGRARLLIGEGIYSLPTDWEPFRPGSRLVVELIADTARDLLRIEFGDFTGSVPLSVWDPQWNAVLTFPRFDLPTTEEQLAAGVALGHEFGPPLDLCTRLRNRLGRSAES